MTLHHAFRVAASARSDAAAADGDDTAAADKKKFLVVTTDIARADKTNRRAGAIEFARVSLTLRCLYFATPRRGQLRLKQV